VQRKPTGVATVTPLTDTSFTDRSIDPYTTYTYCVIAVNDSGQSACSNEVTVGPPPFGFGVVVPTTPDTAYRFGTVIRMELDGNGDPALSYLDLDPNGDGDENDDTLFFVSWNRARYAWNASVNVAVIGAAMMSGPSVPVSLARDADTDVWGLAYEWENAAGASIQLATSSDGGATWKSQSVTGDPISGVLEEPSLAMWQGSFHLAYLSDNSFRYATGKLSDDPAKWKSQPVPLPGGYSSTSLTVSLALDSAHNPGIAFLVSNDSGTATAFWRPAGGGSAVLVGRNDGTIDDNPDIALSFFGTEPRIATDAIWNYDLYDQDYDHMIWAMRGVGDGSNWLPPVNVPSDGNMSLNSPSIATGSRGQTAIAMESIHGGVGDGACGFPKLSRSDDFLTFKTCGPAPVHHPDFAAVDYPVVRFGGNDKLWLAFHNSDTNGDLASGLVLWREQ
jgi:hypothetical protein